MGQSRRTVHELPWLPDRPGEERYFEISSYVIQAHGEPTDAPDLLVVLVTDVTEQEREVAQQRQALAQAEERARHAQELLEQSTRSVRDLLSANQDLSIANARLRSTNEELLMGNEEAQAAMEEIETLNEEQQATNEELETLNEELQATVEELNATNEDLQARTAELQEQGAAQLALVTRLEEQSERLEAVLSSMQEAVAMVDSAGKIVLTNRAFQESFGDMLPPLQDSSGALLADSEHPLRRAARGEVFVQPFVVQCPDGTRRSFEARGQPVHREGAVGGVVVIRDLSN
jgi:two-component system CheB/CheR fusion protein